MRRSVLCSPPASSIRPDRRSQRRFGLSAARARESPTSLRSIHDASRYEERWRATTPAVITVNWPAMAASIYHRVSLRRLPSTTATKFAGFRLCVCRDLDGLNPARCAPPLRAAHRAPLAQARPSRPMWQPDPTGAAALADRAAAAPIGALTCPNLSTRIQHIQVWKHPWNASQRRTVSPGRRSSDHRVIKITQ